MINTEENQIVFYLWRTLFVCGYLVLTTRSGMDIQRPAYGYHR